MATEILTAERLRELLDYDPETGVFQWKIVKRGIKRGRPAGCTRKDGYTLIRIEDHLHLAHRLAYLYMTGRWPEKLLDHIDCNPSNNRWSNLRDADHSENFQNPSRVRSTNAIGCRGVCFVKSYAAKPWKAAVQVRGEIWSRHFDTLLDAAAWVKSERARRMPFSKEAALA